MFIPSKLAMPRAATMLLAAIAIAGGLAVVRAELDPSWQDTEMTTRCVPPCSELAPGAAACNASLAFARARRAGDL